MTKKIISKFKTFFATFLLKLALAAGSPGLAARALSVVAWRIGKGQHRVLCLGRSVFVEDIKAMARYSGQIEYVVVHLQYFEVMLSYFVPPHERKLITEANYRVTNAGREGKQRYRDFLNRLLPKLRRALGIQAILSAQVSYVVQQELYPAAADHGIPFIVLHKEALDVYGGILDVYRSYKFAGARVLFYNQRIREELIKRIEGLSTENTAVVGIPRLDFYFQEAREPKDKQIAFFCFFPQDKFLATIKDEAKLVKAKQAYAEFHKSVIDFAANHPDFNITMKTKNAQYYLDYVLEIFQKTGRPQLSNLTITNSAKSANLIRDAAVIIGFDSTTLIEAVALRRSIISPDFRGFSPNRSWDFFAGFEGLVNYVKDYHDLEKLLLNPAQMKNDPRLREVFLREIAGEPDGRASQRAENAIIETINNFR